MRNEILDMVEMRTALGNVPGRRTIIRFAVGESLSVPE